MGVVSCPHRRFRVLCGVLRFDIGLVFHCFFGIAVCRFLIPI